MFLVDEFIVKDIPESGELKVLNIADEVQVYCSDQDALSDAIGRVRVHINGEFYRTFLRRSTFLYSLQGFKLISGKLHYYIIFTDEGLKYDVTMNGAPHLHKVNARIFSYKEISRKQFLELDWFDKKIDDIIDFIKEYKPEDESFIKIKQS